MNGPAMESSRGFKVNSPNVVYQIFDDEVVIIDLGTGTYYSLTGAAADVWVRIEGATSNDLIEGIMARYGTSRNAAEGAVVPFLDELKNEGLIVADGAPGGSSQSPNGWTAHAASRLPGLDTLVLHKYSDMQELLLLDPIHEVDDVGWPAKPGGGTSRP